MEWMEWNLNINQLMGSFCKARVQLLGMGPCMLTHTRTNTHKLQRPRMDMLQKRHGVRDILWLLLLLASVPLNVLSFYTHNISLSWLSALCAANTVHQRVTVEVLSVTRQGKDTVVYELTVQTFLLRIFKCPAQGDFLKYLLLCNR